MEQEDFMDDLAAVIANTIRKENRHPQKIQHNHSHLLFYKKNQHLGTSIFQLVLN
jgi:hypothetical protein